MQIQLSFPFTVFTSLDSVTHSSLCFVPPHYHNTNHSSNNVSKSRRGLNGVFDHLSHKVLCDNFHNEQKWTTVSVLCPKGNAERCIGVTEEQGGQSTPAAHKDTLSITHKWGTISNCQVPSTEFESCHDTCNQHIAQVL